METDQKTQLMQEIALKRSTATLAKDITPKSVETWTSKIPLDMPLDRKFELAANVFVEQAIRHAEDLKARDAMVAAGIAVEKMQLLRGLPTEIVAVAGILIKIGEKAADQGLSLRQILTAVLDQM